MRPIDYSGFTPDDPAEVIRQNPDAADRMTEALKVVIGRLEEMKATAEEMLKTLAELGKERM